MVELMKALETEEVAAIGVYGMGGVGKTTMVKHLSAQAQKRGFLTMRLWLWLSQIPNTTNIQGALADLTFLEESENGRASRLHNEILRRTKMLIILNDIWDRLDLSSIGIPNYNELHICNSKLLFTIRRLNVCHTMESQPNIRLYILSKEDAWKMFSKKARKSFHRSPEFYEVVRKVARECAGLPIAVIEVARALGDKDFEEWKEAVRQLEMSQPSNRDQERVVFKCIKLSYDYLNNDDAKSCFLLCCLFPEDSDIEIENLMKYGFGTELFRDANSTIENVRATTTLVTKYLKASRLLLNSTRKGCVRMHDVIRDIAMSIASSVDGRASLVKSSCHMNNWSMDGNEGYSAISLIKSNISKLPEKLVSSKLQILLLQENVHITEIPKTFFQSPNDLRVLDLRRTRISLLLPSFSLVTTLQALHLDNCPYITNLPMFRKLKKLEILSMRGCYSLKKCPT